MFRIIITWLVYHNTLIACLSLNLQSWEAFTCIDGTLRFFISGGLCFISLYVSLDKMCDLTSMQVRWEDHSWMWNGVWQVHLQTAVFWRKLRSLCRRILLLPSMHPYVFSSLLHTFSLWCSFFFRSNLSLTLNNYEYFQHLLSFDRLIGILFRLFTGTANFKTLHCQSVRQLRVFL